MIIPGLVVGAVVVDGTYYVTSRWLTPASAPECVERYNASAVAYLESLQEGRLDAGIIEQLISDLAAVVAYADENAISLDFFTQQAAVLVKFVDEFTTRLAEANSIGLRALD